MRFTAVNQGFERQHKVMLTMNRWLWLNPYTLLTDASSSETRWSDRLAYNSVRCHLTRQHHNTFALMNHIIYDLIALCRLRIELNFITGCIAFSSNWPGDHWIKFFKSHMESSELVVKEVNSDIYVWLIENKRIDLRAQIFNYAKHILVCLFYYLVFFVHYRFWRAPRPALRSMFEII